MDRIADTISGRVVRLLASDRRLALSPRATLAGSRSLIAIKDLLQGAIVMDTFALAHWGLANSRSWSSRSREYRMSYIRADSLNTGLGPRDSLLVLYDSIQAWIPITPELDPTTREAAQSRALALISTVTTSYPDEPVGWFAWRKWPNHEAIIIFGDMTDPLIIARSGTTDLALLPGLANRHGCITGATGTGKTVSLQVMAEHFSRIGVPVFLADVKGDLGGLSQAGTATEKLAARLQKLGLPTPVWGGCPVTFWDVFGEQGHPVRATISDMGPLLLARLLNLNETQEGVLSMAFRVADDNGLLLLNLADLRAMLQFLGDNAAEVRTQYGNVSPASIGAIQRGLLQLEDQGAARFFGEPMLNIEDLMQTVDGRGVVNILAADRLMNNPRLYACLLLWLLAELFENLPEVGDREKPKLVFFFDEAHLLFADAPDAVLEKVELVVRLIRSRGVGVYFVTQNPIDVPDKVLGQLGNRVQHALRAFTPRDQKAVKATAQTMRQNPEIDIEKAILELGVGEALVSLLDAGGSPGVTQRAWMLAPGSRIGPISPDERRALMAGSMVAGAYDTEVDRESAFEKLRARAEASGGSAGSQTSAQPFLASNGPAGAGTGIGVGGIAGAIAGAIFGSTGPRGGRREGLIEIAAKTATRTASNRITGSLLRGVLGSLVGRRRR